MKKKPQHASPEAARPIRRRRQWGAEKRRDPLPTIHPIPSQRRIILGHIAIITTVVFWALYVVTTVVREVVDGVGGFQFTAEAISYVVVVTFLSFSALMYLVARQGAMERFSRHARVPRSSLDALFDSPSGRLTVLVPSYAEEVSVVRATLWSAALQEYPDLRVVLLLDDPISPAAPEAIERLRQTRALSTDIMEALSVPRNRFREALERFDSRAFSEVEGAAVTELADHFSFASEWLESFAASEPRIDHVDDFFADQVLLGLARELREIAAALQAAREADAAPTPARMRQLHRRLAMTFAADLEVFERKRYASLSDEANKAMNLNSYIGLMGRSFRSQATARGIVLHPVEAPEDGDLTVPDSEYLLTLDADSLLLRDYCIRLVYLLRTPGNERIAVTQTPYSSFRGAHTRLERLAAATTDLQHILHQGMSHHGATFWVGANAVIRKSALEDILETTMVDGFEIRRYVQDRTVIEDTESTVDLVAHGWHLLNYPERLSYSATPPDFGSLIVQRGRWANGGLLILPKLWREVRERRRDRHPVPWTEIGLRVNYMGSIAWASFGLILLLAYPYNALLLSPIIVLTALPYFLAMASDLRSLGYRRSDVFRIYGFNLILLPVNLAGVIGSLWQGATRRKTAFARTPKVRNRTPAPALYILGPWAIVAFSALTVWRDYLEQNWVNGAFALLNAVLALGAIVSYIGVWASIADLVRALRNWLVVEVAARPGPSGFTTPGEIESPTPLDWSAVLDNGHGVTNGSRR